MLRRAQVQFVKKQFDRALTLSLTALQELNKSSTENITSLEHISRQNVPDKNIQDETKCMAIILQSLYEMKRYDEAKKCLAQYYTQYEYPPVELWLAQIRMLISISDLKNAEKEMNQLKKVNVEAYQLVQTELEPLLKAPPLKKPIEETPSPLVKTTPKSIATLRDMIFTRSTLIVFIVMILLICTPMSVKLSIWRSIQDAVNMALRIV
jgi:hypothetical protein